MNIREALDAARRGERVSREAWVDATVRLMWVVQFDLGRALSAYAPHAPAGLQAWIGSHQVGPFALVEQRGGMLRMGLAPWSPDIEDAEADDWRILRVDETVSPPQPNEPEQKQLRPATIE